MKHKGKYDSLSIKFFHCISDESGYLKIKRHKMSTAMKEKWRGSFITKKQRYSDKIIKAKTKYNTFTAYKLKDEK